MPNIHHFGSAAIIWCKKLAFTDSHTERRITLKIGDFVKFRNGYLGHIEVFFVHDHDVTQQRRLFAKVKLVKPHTPPKVDECLDLPIMRFSTSDQLIFVGLPSIQAERMYLVPVRAGGQADVPAEERSRLGDSTSDTLVWVTWTLQYL